VVGVSPSDSDAGPETADRNAPPPGPGVDAGGNDALVGDGAASDAGVDAPPDAAPAPILTLAVAPAPTPVDLTAEGTIDWAHWGRRSDSTPNRKATGGAVISGYDLSGSANDYSNSGSGWPFVASWSDGDPVAPTVPGTAAHRSFDGSSMTVSLSAPGGVVPRALTIYAGGYRIKGRIDVQLDDGSAPAVGDESLSSSSDYYAARYRIDYLAASPSAKVVVRLTVVTSYSGTSGIVLASATLR
jgi:hypothetical protein